ncbi:hypothetical protein O7599_03375 [Streptomyces sp. WMMC500]|uniref:hypothetical protein n=1 Tax=Streptomyces sp. WMMC500 TaxID=3015154 RepID=UPI00248CC548|nr:hypothetical protein [Streptomyces sp. WMMC500]WBB61611.1 hypothetical protein O7599_03375 [Streptomyces sp. WMMC500]
MSAKPWVDNFPKLPEQFLACGNASAVVLPGFDHVRCSSLHRQQVESCGLGTGTMPDLACLDREIGFTVAAVAAAVSAAVAGALTPGRPAAAEPGV